jgi:amidase
VLRRRPAPIGEPQRGTNCQLSPSSGLPAISLPAGFTDDGVPIGVELIGAAWSEAQLLTLAYSYEQATHPRRPPSTTPALANGKRPLPVLTAGSLASNTGGASVRYSLRYDVATGNLGFEFVPPPGTTIVTSALRRGAKGPVVAVLSNPSGSATAGTAILGQAAQAAVRAGDLFVEVALDRGGLMAGPVALTK